MKKWALTVLFAICFAFIATGETYAFKGPIAGAGNPGEIQYAGASKDLTSTSDLFWDYTNSRLGVLTNAPDYALDVAGDIGLNQHLYHNDDTDNFMAWGVDTYSQTVGNEVFVEITEDDSQDIYKIGDGGDIDVNLNDAVFIEGSSGTVYIGDTANEEMDGPGVTINQGGNDDHILTFKATDVSHSYTSVTESDTFAYFGKAEANVGGLDIRGIKGAEGSNYQALKFQAILSENVDTTKSTSGHGLMELLASQSSGGSVANVVADGNIYALRAYTGGAWTTLWILDEDGDTWQSGSLIVEGETFNTGGLSLGSAADAQHASNNTFTLDLICDSDDSDSTSDVAIRMYEDGEAGSGSLKGELRYDVSDDTIELSYGGNLGHIAIASGGLVHLNSAVFGNDLNGIGYRDLLIAPSGTNGYSLGYDSSSIRGKTNVRNLTDTEWIYDLRPVVHEAKTRRTVETVIEPGRTYTKTVQDPPLEEWVEVTKEEALVEVLVDDKSQEPHTYIDGPTTVRYNLVDGEVVQGIIIEKIPVYDQVKKKQVKDGYKFDHKTGKFYRWQVTPQSHIEVITVDAQIEKSWEYTDTGNGIDDYGLIAEEVDQVNKRLVFYDDKERTIPAGVHYNKRLIVPILSEVQKHETKIKALEAKISVLEARLDALEAK